MQKLSAPPRGVRILCDYLTIIGLLSKRGSSYALTPDSAMFLDRRSPACMASAARFLNAADVMGNFHDIAGVVRRGGPGENHSTVAPENPVWVEFARSMAPMMRMPAEFISELVSAGGGVSGKTLDIAAGHGLFGIAIARRNPNLQIVALDWAAVLEVAKENAQNAGLADRYQTIAGDAFSVDLGSGYDLVLLTNFLHHFDQPTCESLLRKVYAALKPGGRAVTLDFVPNEDRVSPPGTASFAMIMFGTTQSGDAYTFSEYEKMFRNAGFSSSEAHSMPGPETVIFSKK